MKEFKISEKALLIWRIRLFVPAFLSAFLTSLFLEFLSTAWLVLTAVWVFVFLFFYLFYLPLYFKKISLTLSNNDIILQNVVFYNIPRTLNKDKIQFVRTIKTPLCRLFKTKSIVIYSAGAKMHIPPIENSADFLRGINNEI